jgi:hypothetical protein
MSKTVPITSTCWEMDRRRPDWRMRSASDEGETMISSPERGPLGPGGVVRRRRPAHRGGISPARAIPKARANHVGRWCMRGSNLSHRSTREDSMLNCAVPGTLSRTGENPPYGILGGAAGDLAMGAGLRPTSKGVEPPPDPTVRAPVPHPTGNAVSWTVGGKRGRSLKTCIDATAASEIVRRRARCGEFAHQTLEQLWGDCSPQR